MTLERMQMSIQTVKDNIKILESQEPESAGYYLQLEHEKLVLSALEKQMPKKVNNLEIFCDIGACVPKVKSGNCPICNNFMIGNHTYCDDCGQALDWSDIE